MIQSVDRAIQILLELQGARHLALSELARRLELSPSTTHGLVKTLTERDLVRQDIQTKRYYLGPTILPLARVYLDASEFRNLALPRIENLVAETGNAVQLGVLSGSDIVVVHRKNPPGSTAQVAEFGMRLPAYSSSLGKAILAFEPASLLETWDSNLPPNTDSTVIKVSDFYQELRNIAKTGVAFEIAESVADESTVGSPIFTSNDRAIGAIAMVVTTTNRNDLREGASRILKTAQAISQQLGGRPFQSDLPKEASE